MSEISLSQADHGQSLRLKPGQILKLCLEENPTTGFRWSLSAFEPKVLLLKRDDFNLPINAAIGGSGERVFIFQANHPGQVKLQLKNQRPWGDEQSLASFEITVDVVE